MSEQSVKQLQKKLHAETAQIAWSELQRFFAKGQVYYVSENIDLIEIAVYFVNDDVAKLAPFVDKKLIYPVTDEQAKAWIKQELVLWSVVVAPFILVQQ